MSNRVGFQWSWRETVSDRVSFFGARKLSKRNPADPYSLNIGRLCHEWEALEFMIESMFGLVSQMPAGPARTMIHCLDVRDLIAAIKIGVVATSTVDLRYWTEEVVGSMDYIDRELRPRRNRYVHDGLWEGHWGIMRSVRTPKVHRPQSRQPLTVKYAVRVESLADLRATRKAITGMVEHLDWLEFYRGYLVDHPEVPREPLQRLRPKSLPPLPTDAPVQLWPAGLGGDSED